MPMIFWGNRRPGYRSSNDRAGIFWMWATPILAFLSMGIIYVAVYVWMSS
jgi:hypothetical protein